MPRARLQLVACVLALLLALPLIVASVCARAGSAAIPTAETPSPAAPLVLPAAAPGSVPGPGNETPAQDRARDAVAAAEGAAAASTELAVAVLDRHTGELALGARGAEPYYVASLAKVVVAVDVLDRSRLEGLAVSDSDIRLLDKALGVSDDSAMSALWSRFDGAGAASRVSARLNLAGTSAPRDPSQWGEMSVSAADFVRIWQYLLEGMPDADRDLPLSALDAAPATAADGFDQAFGLLSPPVRGPDGPGAVAKQGWMCCFSAQRYLHSAGAVGADRRFLVALLTRQPRSGGWEAARQELDRIAIATVKAIG